jgi:uncharacterized protein YqeY
VTLIERIEDQLKAAMRARDRERAGTLRLALAALRSSEKELRRPLSEAEERELAIVEEFMPEPIGEEELEQIVDDAIAETGATSLRDFGRVMADVMPQVAGRADGSTVSSLVREKLA